MKAQKKTIVLAAAALLSGVGAASAAPIAPKASDSLSLSSTQQKTAWRDLYMPSLNQKAPAGFNARVGAIVPKGVTTAPVPTKAASAVPALKPYDFAMVQHRVVIVNPSDQKVAEVISG